MNIAILEGAVHCLEQNGYEFSKLPKDWNDTKWSEIKDVCGLSFSEITALQWSAEYRNEYCSKTVYIDWAMNRVINCGIKRNELPKDFFDQKWFFIKEKAYLSNSNFLGLRHTIALEDEQQELHDAIAIGNVMRQWVDPVTSGDKCAPLTTLRRRAAHV